MDTIRRQPSAEGEVDVSNMPLDYRGPESKPPSTPAAIVLATLSLGVLAVPVIGGVTRNGPLFLGGGLIAPIVGMVLAGTGLKSGHGSGAGTACGFALAINILVIAFFALGILNMIV